jgi:hypothetical protein
MVGPITFERRSAEASWTVTDARPLLFGSTVLGGAAFVIGVLYRDLAHPRGERRVDTQHRSR